MVFRSRILICFQKPKDLLQKSDANEDDDEDDEEDDEDVDDGFWKQNTNLLPNAKTFDSRSHDFLHLKYMTLPHRVRTSLNLKHFAVYIPVSHVPKCTGSSIQS